MNYPIYNDPMFQSPQTLNIGTYQQTSPDYILDNSPYYTEIDVSENIIQQTKNNIQTFIANLKGEEIPNNYYNRSLENPHFRFSKSNSINKKQIIRHHNNMNYNNNIINNSINNNLNQNNQIPFNFQRGISPVPYDSSNNNFYDNSNDYSPFRNNNQFEINDDYRERSAPKNKLKTKLIKNKIKDENNNFMMNKNLNIHTINMNNNMDNINMHLDNMNMDMNNNIDNNNINNNNMNINNNNMNNN